MFIILETLDESAAISPKALAKQLNLGNPIHLEKRIKRELEEQGMFTLVVFNCILYPFPKQALVFSCLQYKSIENTVRKGEMARKEHFFLICRLGKD